MDGDSPLASRAAGPFFVFDFLKLVGTTVRIGAANEGEAIMVYWAFLFLVIAIVAGLLGFGLVAGTAFVAAKILFFVFLVLFVVMLIAGAVGRPAV
jgi:uncharacterized membrane protein YtjA (UPF0391 family)